jgi:hypothetical protein
VSFEYSCPVGLTVYLQRFEGGRDATAPFRELIAFLRRFGEVSEVGGVPPRDRGPGVQPRESCFIVFPQDRIADHGVVRGDEQDGAALLVLERAGAPGFREFAFGSDPVPRTG